MRAAGSFRRADLSVPAEDQWEALRGLAVLGAGLSRAQLHRWGRNVCTCRQGGQLRSGRTGPVLIPAEELLLWGRKASQAFSAQPRPVVRVRGSSCRGFAEAFKRTCRAGGAVQAILLQEEAQRRRRRRKMAASQVS